MDGPTIRLMPGERRQQRVRIYGCDPSARVMVLSATWELHDFLWRGCRAGVLRGVRG